MSTLWWQKDFFARSIWSRYKDTYTHIHICRKTNENSDGGCKEEGEEGVSGSRDEGSLMALKLLADLIHVTMTEKRVRVKPKAECRQKPWRWRTLFDPLWESVWQRIRVPKGMCQMLRELAKEPIKLLEQKLQSHYCSLPATRFISLQLKLVFPQI